LRFIAQSDLRVLDPIWTTAYITRNHGYMVFDTLFALDAEFAPHPQMVGSHDISSDKLSYGFTLRDGLKFHDGERVRGIDCIASLRRWMARDSFGQALATAIDEMTVAGDTSFTIRLREPFPLLIDALAKVSSLVPFIMPERLAETDPYQQVTEMVGSGPFKFVAEEFQPGHKVVYVKNPDYVPRDEPPSWASGGKVVKVDRVEWLYVPDAMTKAAALTAGEADWWENPPFDIHPLLSSNPDITLAKTDPFGGMGCLRFNHLRPPFDNVKMRQAVLAVADQADFMTVFAGDPKNWKVCPSFFTCGTPMASEVGSTALTGKRDFDRAKKLIAEAGYKGETIVVLDAVDQPNPACACAGRRGSAEKARAQCRDRGQRLGQSGHPQSLEGDDRQRRLEYLRHRCGGLRRARSDAQRVVAHEWRRGMVRLAERRQDRGVAAAMDQGHRPRNPQNARGGDPRARL
jgi:peptide/nickel transport system substrate-binding protein